MTRAEKGGRKWKEMFIATMDEGFSLGRYEN
jgi:hypothetical protein